MIAWPVPPAVPVFTGNGAAFNTQMRAWNIDFLPLLAIAMQQLETKVEAITPSVEAALLGDNFKGDYNPLTAYAISEGVAYNNGLFLKKTAAPAGTTPVNGVNWLEMRPPVSTQEFTSSGSSVIPSGATFCMVELLGAGGGGGSGRRGATSTLRVGGGGGGGGTFVPRTFKVSDLAGPITVTIGAGGAPGAAVAVDSTNGAPGSDGGNTTFGSHLTAEGGRGGAGGDTGATLGGRGGSLLVGKTYASGDAGGLIAVTPSTGANAPDGVYAGGGGGSADTTAARAGGSSLFGGIGAGGGGTITAANGTPNGGPGGTRTVAKTSSAAPGANGVAGSDTAGASGGGPNGGIGGAGTFRGNGGAGGGASLNGTLSGVGGAGAPGWARVTYW